MKRTATHPRITLVEQTQELPLEILKHFRRPPPQARSKAFERRRAPFASGTAIQRREHGLDLCRLLTRSENRAGLTEEPGRRRPLNRETEQARRFFRRSAQRGDLHPTIVEIR